MKVGLQINDKKYLSGISRPIPAIIGRTYKIGCWEFTWWGLSQIHKWRWHKSHIDLGALSIYGFRYNHLFWRTIALIVKPLRWYYHSKFVRPNRSVELEVN